MVALLVSVGLLLFANQNLTRQNQQPTENTIHSVISPTPDVGITATYIASLPGLPTAVDIGSSATPVIPTATSTLAPPHCTFPLAQITTTDLEPDEYTFSEPEVMLIAEKGNTYNLAEWLPDNEQVLITEDLRNLDVDNNAPLQESIALYNTKTGQSKLYALRPLTYEPPSWLPDWNAVIYPAINYTSLDRQNGSYSFTRQIRISDGNQNTSQVIADNLSQIPFAIKPGAKETVYLSDQKLSKLDQSLKNISSISIDFTQWDYAKQRRDDQPFSYMMAWQPGTSLIFLYSWAGGTQDGGYTFLLDTETGQVCELSIGGWAVRAHWSSDGRYLALIRSALYSGLTNSTDLVVLDTTTGNLLTIGVTSQDLENEHYVDDFTWAPDNRHLLALGHTQLQNTSSETIHHDLYLVDFMSDQSVHLFPEFRSFIANGPPRNNIAWSPDGSKLLIRCPTNGVDRICLINTQRTGQ